MKPEDKIILILAIAVALFVILALFNPIVRGVSVNPENAKTLRDIIVSLITIISMYIGMKVKNKSE